MVYLETERLILRNFKNEDFDDTYEFLYQRKDDIFEGYPNLNPESGLKKLKYRVDNDEFYCIELKETGKVIGNVYFGNREFNSKEIGYIINKNYQRKGYGREACKAVIDNAFMNGIHRIFAECDPRNNCSWGLLENLGFTKEAYLRMNVSFFKDENGNPIYQNTLVYGLLETDKISR